MNAYSQDLRERVLRAWERGERPSDIARQFEVSRMWVYSVQQRWQATGNCCALRMEGYRRSWLLPWESTLHCWVTEQPDLTLAQLCQRLAKQRGVDPGTGVVASTELVGIEL